MTIRATLFALVVGTLAAAGCGGRKQNKVMADTPVLPYIAPDIAEITGIDEDEDEPAEEPEAAPEPAPAPAPTPAAAAPAPSTPTTSAKTPAPAKAPAKK